MPCSQRKPSAKHEIHGDLHADAKSIEAEERGRR